MLQTYVFFLPVLSLKFNHFIKSFSIFAKQDTRGTFAEQLKQRTLTQTEASLKERKVIIRLIILAHCSIVKEFVASTVQKHHNNDNFPPKMSPRNEEINHNILDYHFKSSSTTRQFFQSTIKTIHLSAFFLSLFSISQGRATERSCESPGTAYPQCSGGEQIQRCRVLLLDAIYAVSGHC